ncbi:MAG: XisI protein [Cyanobacteria bacterium P01_E01_bin.42]
MDRQLEQYSTIARDIINDYARYKPSQGEIELQAIADRDSFLLISFGWNSDRRVHSTIIHLRVTGGKFWVERDETEEGITQDLLDCGVPKEDIPQSSR